MQQAKIDGEKIISVEGISDGKLKCFYLGRIPRSFSRKQNPKLGISLSVIYGNEI